MTPRCVRSGSYASSISARAAAPTSCHGPGRSLRRLRRGGKAEKEYVMRLIFATALAAACVVGSTPGFARNDGHPGHARHRTNPTTLLGPAAPTPAFESRDPAPLPPPAQAPVI